MTSDLTLRSSVRTTALQLTSDRPSASVLTEKVERTTLGRASGVNGRNSQRDIAGNQLRQAKGIRLGRKNTLLRNQLGAQNRRDFYRFALSGEQNFTLNLTGIQPGANVRVDLLDESGNLYLTSTDRRNGRRQFIRALVDAGQYFVRVVLRGRQTINYRLKLGATPPPDRAGNTLRDARALALTPSTPATVSDFVGSTGDSVDYYQVTLTDKSTQLTATALGTNDFVELQILDADGVLFGRDRGSQASSSAILGAGTYYVAVSSFAESSSFYNLTVNSTPIADAAGETPASARTIALGSSPSRFDDFVGNGDPSDYYRFTVTAASTLSAALAPSNPLPTGVTTLQFSLVDAADQPVSIGYSSDAINTFSQSLLPGTYWLKVAASDRAQANYGLTLNLVAG